MELYISRTSIENEINTGSHFGGLSYNQGDWSVYAFMHPVVIVT